MANYIPADYHTLTTCYTVDGAHNFIEFLKQAFGAEITAMHTDDENRVMCGELKIGDSMIMVFDSKPPQWQAQPAAVYLYTKDCDALYRRALDAGAKSVHEPMDMHYGDRSGGVQDKWGNYWWIATHKEDLTPEQIKERQPATANK